MIPLSWMVPRYRELWRFRAPLSAGEIRRTERWLATARVALSIAAVFAVWWEPARGTAYPFWMWVFLGIYLVHGVVVMLLLRFRLQSTRNFRLVVHSVDIVWPVLISIFTTTQRGPFFLFFVFVMVAAAYRWGLWETLGTAAAAVALLWAEALAVREGLERVVNAWLRVVHLPPLNVSMRQMEPQQLFMSSVYLMVLGGLLAYMAENQKKVRAERAVITRVLSSTRVEAGLTGTMQQILGEILSIYGARRVVSASQEKNSYRVFLWEVNRNTEGAGGVRSREAPPATETKYLFESPAEAIYAARNSEGFQTVALDYAGNRLRAVDTGFLDALTGIETFHTMLSVAFIFGGAWSSRVFMFDPEMMGEPEEELRYLQEFGQQVGPAIYNVYLVRRLREQAGEEERQRLALELHDGAIQSLIAVEMQLDVLRRQSGTQSPVVNSELGRIQKLLREEVLNLRELMQAM